jgi:hypothetical protein
MRKFQGVFLVCKVKDGLQPQVPPSLQTSPDRVSQQAGGLFKNGAIPYLATRCRDPKSRGLSLLNDALLSRPPKPPIPVGKYFAQVSEPNERRQRISEIEADFRRNTQVIPSFPIWSTAPPS